MEICSFHPTHGLSVLFDASDENNARKVVCRYRRERNSTHARKYATEGDAADESAAKS